MHGCLEDLAKLVWMECTWRLASASAACGEPMTLARICSVWPSIQARPIRCVARVAFYRVSRPLNIRQLIAAKPQKRL